MLFPSILKVLLQEKFATYQYPEHVFKLFTTYTFPDEHLTIGGGLRAQSKLYYESGAFNVEQPAYAVADVMAKYDFNEQTALQLNVNNLSIRIIIQP